MRWPRGTLRTSILLSGIRNNKCRSPGLTTAQCKSIYRSPGLTPAVLDGLPYRYPDSRYPIPGIRNNKCRSPGLTQRKSICRSPAFVIADTGYSISGVLITVWKSVEHSGCQSRTPVNRFALCGCQSRTPVFVIADTG